MSLFATYTSQEFNNLPFLGASNKALEASSGREALFSDLKVLFARYGVIDRFGITLVHRHFDLNQNEVLVESNGTTMPWTTTGLRDEDGTIRPHSWAVLRGRLMPFEFYFEPNFASPELSSLDYFSGVDPGFFDEFKSLLQLQNLDTNLGICLLSRCPEPQIELTRERANITFNVSQDEFRSAQDGFIDVVWGCTDAIPGIVAFKKCKKTNSTSSKEQHLIFNQQMDPEAIVNSPERGFLAHLAPCIPRYPYGGKDQYVQYFEKMQYQWFCDPGNVSSFAERDFLNEIQQDGDGPFSRWTSYDATLGLLLVRLVKSLTHEIVANVFDMILVEAVQPMGMTREIAPGRSQYWPSAVLEIAYSETQSKLQSDVRFWLRSSGGDVGVVFTLNIDSGQSRITI
ncbi:hypothetical protein BJX99DRAFT_262046 [Aspergillus californicus]